jgi:cobyrinic acid a,c-diamide synthase
MPERHLGLLPAAEIEGPRSASTAWPMLLAPTAAAPPAAVEVFNDVPPPKIAACSPANDRHRPRRGFCFLYPANLDCLSGWARSSRIFSPLADAALPPCDAVWLPGGYPELHGPALAANRRCGNRCAAHVDAGKPLLAECGGMMALFERPLYFPSNPGRKQNCSVRQSIRFSEKY